MPKTGGFNRTLKIAVGMIDVVLYHLSFVLSFYLRYRGQRPQFNYSAYKSALPYIMVSFILINIFSGVYVLYNKRTIDMLTITLISQVLMTVLIMAFTFFGRWFAFPRTILFINLIISIIILIVWRILVLELYLRRSGTNRVMIVGPEDKSRDAIRNFKHSNNRQYQVVSATIDNYLKNIQDNIDDIDVFYLLDFNSREEEYEILSYLTLEDKRIFLAAEFENLLRINNRIMNIDDESLISIAKFEISPEKEMIKRLMDFIISLFLIIITSPIMLIAMLLIKITSEGPILYKQTRITKNQKEFDVYKFRSMRNDAENLSGPVLAEAQDPRVTKVGSYLRSLRIDELPQLFNVLKGDMSIVGPRPERPYFVEQFNKENPYYYLRHKVRAGITGYAQVHGTYSTNYNSKLKFDLLYIKKYSLMMDIQLLFQTVRILFDKVSSKGLEEELSAGEILNDVNIYD